MSVMYKDIYNKKVLYVFLVSGRKQGNGNVYFSPLTNCTANAHFLASIHHERLSSLLSSC